MVLRMFTEILNFVFLLWLHYNGGKVKRLVYATMLALNYFLQETMLKRCSFEYLYYFE